MQIYHCFELVFVIYCFISTIKSSNLCHNGGTMRKSEDIDINHPKLCDCTPEWTGLLCRKRKCVYGKLRNNTCVCHNHYNGSACNKLISCSHGNLTDSGRCQCEGGWYGRRCDRKECNNGIHIYHSDRCHCFPGYSGPSCDIYSVYTTRKPSYRPPRRESSSPWSKHPLFLGALALLATGAFICMLQLCKHEEKDNSRNDEPVSLLPSGARVTSVRGRGQSPVVTNNRTPSIPVRSLPPRRPPTKTAIVQTEEQEDMPPSYDEAIARLA